MDLFQILSDDLKTEIGHLKWNTLDVFHTSVYTLKNVTITVTHPNYRDVYNYFLIWICHQIGMLTLHLNLRADFFLSVYHCQLTYSPNFKGKKLLG